MTREHYHVGMNVPGYLPEGEVLLALSKLDAIDMLRERKEQLLEDHATLGDEADQITVAGDARKDMGYLVSYPERRHHLGLSIWAIACWSSDCTEEQETWR